MSENKRYYWLKLKEDFFDDDTIQFIEEQENGILYSNFYLKLCLKSLKNDGRLIRLVGNTLMPYDVKSLAKLTRIDVDTVRVAMELFKKFGLVEILDTGEIYMSQINEMIGSETKKAIEKRALRARQKRERLEMSQCDASVTLSDVDVICCDEEKEIDKEIEKEIELDTEKNNKWVTMFLKVGDKKETMSPRCLQNVSPEIRDKEIRERDKEIEKDELDTPYLTCNSKAVTQKQISCTDIVNLYHSICLSYPKIIKISEARKKAIKARLNQYSLEDFRQVFENAEDSDFLKGNNQRDWSATFDWLISDKNMPKVLEGKYNNNKKKNRGKVNDEQCYTDEQLRIARDLEDFIAKGYTIESLQRELDDEFPDWFLDYYNKNYTADGKKIQM